MRHGFSIGFDENSVLIPIVVCQVRRFCFQEVFPGPAVR